MTTVAADLARPSYGSTAESEQGHTRLRLLSYNIQAGIATSAYRHYFTRSWRHLLPNSGQFTNLDRIGALLCDFDVVALQEADAGSLRSGFTNQVEYLARQGSFPFWHAQINRNLGKIAQISNGLLSRYRPSEIVEHRLPGLIPGRGALLARYGHRDNPLVLVLLHLALSRRARHMQLDYVRELVRDYEHVVVMGDLNCPYERLEEGSPLSGTRLRMPGTSRATFPSWRPMRNLDHILVTPSLRVNRVQVLNHSVSDHLPVAMEVTLPPGVRLTSP